MEQKPSRSKRQLLLEAAGRVVLAEGAANLNLEAAAREAGVSKGGLLYHFPTKDDLIAGMVEHIGARFARTLEQERARDPDTTAPGHWLRAYIRASFAPDQNLFALSAGLLAAVATDPALLAPLRERRARVAAALLSLAQETPP